VLNSVEGALVQRAGVDDFWELGKELLGQGREPSIYDSPQ